MLESTLLVIKNNPCPTCKVEPGENCRTPSGKKLTQNVHFPRREVDTPKPVTLRTCIEELVDSWDNESKLICVTDPVKANVMISMINEVNEVLKKGR